MGLFDRTKPVQFADGNSIEAKRSVGSEIGVSGESVVMGFASQEARTDSLSVSDYVKMRQNDGTVSSLYAIMTLPVLAASYSIEQDQDNDPSGEVSSYIESALTDPPHKGGMEIPLSLLLADMLRSVLEGFRLYERVYAIRPDGKIGYRKLAPRDSATIQLERSDDGGYGGAFQRTTFKGKMVEVQIPAWKTFLFTYGKDKNFLYGESAFKAAYYHYDIKHRLYYLSNLQAQTRAIPPITAQPTGDNTNRTDSVKNSLLSQLSKLGRTRTVAHLPQGYDVQAMDMGKGAMDFATLIDHHNTEMARSVLAQFIMLGTGSASSGGSYALSNNHSDVFIIALKGIMQSIEDHINFYVIPDLVDLNFPNGGYPEFHFEDMTSDTKEVLRGAFNELIKQGKITEAMAKGIEDRVSESLDLDTEEIQAELDKAAKENPPEPTPPAVVPTPPESVKPDAKVEKPQVTNQSDKAADPDPKDLPTINGPDRSRQQNSESILHKLRSGLPL